jgi:hypothetical protein
LGRWGSPTRTKGLSPESPRWRPTTGVPSRAQQRLGPWPAPCPVAVAGNRDRVGARRCSLPAGADAVPDPVHCSCRCSWFWHPDARVAEIQHRRQGALLPSAGSPENRPSVTFGFASAPAQRPAATRIATFTRSPAVASGRLDGLPRSRCTLLRHALPEDCQSRGCAHQMREAAGTTSRMARPTAAPFLVHPGGPRITGPAEQEKTRDGDV